MKPNGSDCTVAPRTGAAVPKFTPPAGMTERQLIADILENPENYYFNVHNTEYPGGAIRGQLSDG